MVIQLKEFLAQVKEPQNLVPHAALFFLINGGAQHASVGTGYLAVLLSIEWIGGWNAERLSWNFCKGTVSVNYSASFVGPFAKPV